MELNEKVICPFVWRTKANGNELHLVSIFQILFLERDGCCCCPCCCCCCSCYCEQWMFLKFGLKWKRWVKKLKNQWELINWVLWSLKSLSCGPGRLRSAPALGANFHYCSSCLKKDDRFKNGWKNDTWNFGWPSGLPPLEGHVLFEWPLTNLLCSKLLRNKTLFFIVKDYLRECKSWQKNT